MHLMHSLDEGKNLENPFRVNHNIHHSEALRPRAAVGKHYLEFVAWHVVVLTAGPAMASSLPAIGQGLLRPTMSCCAQLCLLFIIVKVPVKKFH